MVIDDLTFLFRIWSPTIVLAFLYFKIITGHSIEDAYDHGTPKRRKVILLIAALVGITAALIVVFLPMQIAVVLIVPFLCLLAFCGFMYTYAAYPVLQKYMIDPVAKKPAEDADAD